MQLKTCKISLGEALGSPTSSTQVRHSRPSCSQPMARARCRQALRQRHPCPRRAGTPLPLEVHPGSAAVLWFSAYIGNVSTYYHVNRQCINLLSTMVRIGPGAYIGYVSTYYHLRWSNRASCNDAGQMPLGSNYYLSHGGLALFSVTGRSTLDCWYSNAREAWNTRRFPSAKAPPPRS